MAIAKHHSQGKAYKRKFIGDLELQGYDCHGRSMTASRQTWHLIHKPEAER